MAGIYIHIPYCKQACSYCDFHFSTQLKSKADLLDAIKLEVSYWKPNFQHSISSVYFGGGTPSLLTTNEFGSLLKTIRENFEVNTEVEVTVECNPDDLNEEKLKGLLDIGVNRLSIGIQSFRNEDLKLMNRAHNADEALDVIGVAKNVGFENLSIDLIYGVPGFTDENWIKNLEVFSEFSCDHLSAYQLTVEPKTLLANQINKGDLKMPEDESVNNQFEILMNWAAENNFEHYEISNFVKNKNYSKHNSSYWKGEPYLGLGPSAHSFDGSKRWWNVANNPQYIKAIENSLDFKKEEFIDAKTRYNEMVMTGLRTKWGVDRNTLLNETGIDIVKIESEILNDWIDDEKIYRKGDVFTLTNSGMLLADRIASSLFLV